MIFQCLTLCTKILMVKLYLITSLLPFCRVKDEDREYKKKIKTTGGGPPPTPPKPKEEISFAASMMAVDLAMGR